MSHASRLNIQVCFLAGARHVVRDVVVPAGTTLERAIRASGIMSMCPEIDLDTHQVGVYARLQPLQAIVQDGDRVEIYRPVDPEAQKNARQIRKNRT